MSPIRIPKCALYARVSTADQKCDLQLNEMRAYCERRGWPVYGEYVDTGWSGAKKSRPQLDKLLAAAKRRMFDCVIVWKIDRFGRSVSNFVEHIELLNSADVRFICLTQSVDTADTNPGSKLLMDIMMAFAEFERSMIRERVKAGINAARKRGVTLGRKRGIWDRDKALELHMRGKSIPAIAKECGVSVGTIWNLLPKKTAA